MVLFYFAGSKSKSKLIMSESICEEFRTLELTQLPAEVFCWHNITHSLHYCDPRVKIAELTTKSLAWGIQSSYNRMAKVVDLLLNSSHILFAHNLICFLADFPVDNRSLHNRTTEKKYFSMTIPISVCFPAPVRCSLTLRPTVLWRC